MTRYPEYPDHAPTTISRIYKMCPDTCPNCESDKLVQVDTKGDEHLSSIILSGDYNLLVCSDCEMIVEVWKNTNVDKTTSLTALNWKLKDIDKKYRPFILAALKNSRYKTTW